MFISACVEFFLCFFNVCFKIGQHTAMKHEAITPSVVCKFASDGATVVCDGFGQKNETWDVGGKLHTSHFMQTPCNFREDECTSCGDSDASLRRAIEIAKLAVRRCKILKARSDRPRDKIVEVLEVIWQMLRSLVARSDGCMDAE